MADGAGSVPGAGPVRGEDAFDVPAVAAWLRTNAADPAGLDGIPDVLQFGGGASNLTYLLRYAGGPAAGGRDLVLRRPPTGTKARGAHDMRREHDIQAALAPVFPYVAPMVAYCGEESVLGSEFYVMERLVGTILRRDVPPELGLTRAGVRHLCGAAVDILVALHDVDVEAAGLAGLARGEGYVARQVGGWSARYRRARTKDVGSFETVMAWLEAHQPPDAGQVLIHNDFRFDNLVLAPDDPTRVVGVLDWEMATVGDPLMDLGGAMAYWVQADDDPVFRRFRRQPTQTPGMLTRVEVVRAYCERRGIPMDADRWAFYEVFGLFRLAVIAQQIWYRYHHGQTTNPAYRQFRWVVLYLDYRCRRLIRRYDRRHAPRHHRRHVRSTP
jgi:aminoglycoside phosphotransferase (APT) family kinase protein